MAQITIPQAFDLALRHHQAGQLKEAEQIYRQILGQQPNHAGALHFLGVVAHQAGRKDVAVDLIRRSIAIVPNDAAAYGNLGAALRDNGQIEDAIAAYRQAISLKPNQAEGYFHLGSALKDGGRIDEAIAAWRRAVAIRPNYAEAHYNLGVALSGKGRLDDAIGAYRRVIAIKPSYEAYTNLGVLLRDKGKLDEAIAIWRQAMGFNPNAPEALTNLGVALRDQGQLDEAIAIWRRVIALKPGHAEAHTNLGNALKDRGQLDEAIAAHRQAVTINSEYAEAHTNLGNALKEKGELDEAIAAHRRAIALKPNLAEAFINLGMALKDAGRLEEAVAANRRAIALEPDNARFGSNLVFSLLYEEAQTPEGLAEENRRWNQRYAEPLRKLIRPFSNGRSPDRTSASSVEPRLRIGYVSPDFRDHCQSKFTLPLLANHAHEQFEIFCYSSVARPDALTERLTRYADTWRHVAVWGDADLARQIRDDRIDILVDLTMHMAQGRLLLMARKPAPVQVTWLAYPGSTGLTAIDYRLSDPYLDPQGMDESIYSEKTIRLPESFWCYDPLDGREIDINPLPGARNDFVTFGCLNNFCKVNDGILALWAQVLGQVERSRLLLWAHPGSHRERTVDRLCQDGIGAERIEFVAPQGHRKYMEIYHRIDVGLDSFPYNGHTTSLDSFWMGVPVVTLVGKTAVSRAGWCQLSNLGLSELAGQTPGEFVRIAVELARDLPRLEELRSTLRGRMEQSPLMDGPRFARNMEAAYRRMWHTWCEK